MLLIRVATLLLVFWGVGGSAVASKTESLHSSESTVKELALNSLEEVLNSSEQWFNNKIPDNCVPSVNSDDRADFISDFLTQGELRITSARSFEQGKGRQILETVFHSKNSDFIVSVHIRLHKGRCVSFELHEIEP